MNWKTFENEIRNLSEKITDKPDMIIGITRGGVVPARLLSTYLDVKKMHCISVAKQDEKRSVVTEITEDISGKKVLLVEDMLETGRSLGVVKAYLEGKGAEVKTACLYTMPISEINPDYFLKEVDSVLEFPWDQ
jgi:hypoxanthine phosphoribosyltransferase